MSATTGLSTVRRVIVFVLLFAFVTLAAAGLSGLLGRLFDGLLEILPGGTGRLAGNDVSGLAQSLAFTLIAGPFAAVLWWSLWRRMAGDERSAPAWGLYIAAMSTVACVTSTTALLGAAAALVADDRQPHGLATGLVWAAVWAWHRWMSGHRDKGPLRLRSVAPVLGSVFGLLIGAGGAITAIGSVFGLAVTSLLPLLDGGAFWWRQPAIGLVWCAGGASVWWWHLSRERVSTMRGGFADVALVCVGIGAALVTTLVGAGVTLYVLLRLCFDSSEPLGGILDPLGPSLAAALVGALVWRYHGRLARRRSAATRGAATLVTSGLALASAATGVGVVVNSLLSVLTDPLVGSDTRALLLGGLSALIVGGPLWWAAWRPLTPRVLDRTNQGNADNDRRVYLVLVFGLSAVVALITLLVVGFRLFEFGLGGTADRSVLEDVRAPLGLLVATGLVAGYHFAVWRRDRSLLAAPEERQPGIGSVILITTAGTDPEPLRRAITESTGAAVTVWSRAGTGAGTDAGTEAGQAAGTEAGQATAVAEALAGVTGKRVLVVTGPGSRIEVIPLGD
jgi:hypothetical protein